MPDLVTFGETMLRLSPPDSERLETTDELHVHVGGAESNAAVTASRLGIESVWLSQLPDTHLGRRVTTELTAHGVTPAVNWSSTGSQGLYYLEPAGTPRETTAIYDRADAAITTATPADLDLEPIEQAEIFFTTGITPGLSDTLIDTTRTLLEMAVESETTTAFDLNYRSKLWDPEQARSTIVDLLEFVDVFVTAERDARVVLGREEQPAAMAEHLASMHDFSTVIVTLGSAGALAVHDEELVRQEAFEVETVDPIGSGDALVGGFLARRLRGDSVGEALEYGTAAAALKRTIPGDMAIIRPADVEGVLSSSDPGIKR